jgi:D-alanine-D-alanine ligase
MAKAATRRLTVQDGEGDFFVVRSNGTVYMNELNTIPGFTSISMYAKLWQASGLSFSALLTA